jgi:methylmalonyl-CoA/ethylmalonyl-CoA epimerase
MVTAGLVALPRLIETEPIKQIAIVVRDLEAAVRAYWDVLQIGPWTAYEYKPSILHEMKYRGEPTTFGLRHALAWKENVQFELLQPLEGPSIFADHLVERGEGFHHIGIYVPDHSRAVAELISLDFALLQSAAGFGATGDGAFAYFASSKLPGIVVELIAAPTVRRPPIFIYPEPKVR